MNDPRYSGRPVRSGTRTAPRSSGAADRRAAERKRRQRARQRRQFRNFVLVCLAAVILISGSVGYLIGYRVGKRS